LTPLVRSDSITLRCCSYIGSFSAKLPLMIYIYMFVFLFLYILYIHLYIQHSQLLHQTILDVFFPSSWSKGGIPIVMRLFTTFPAGLGKPQMVVNYESGNPTTKMAYKNSD